MGKIYKDFSYIGITDYLFLNTYAKGRSVRPPWETIVKLSTWASGLSKIYDDNGIFCIIRAENKIYILLPTVPKKYIDNFIKHFKTFISDTEIVSIQNKQSISCPGTLLTEIELGCPTAFKYEKNG